MVTLNINSLDSDLLHTILDKSEHLQFKRNEIVVRMGTVCNYLFIIEQGLLRNYYFDKKGHDITHWFSSEGMVVTVPPSFFRRELSYFEIQAIEHTSVRAISYQIFQNELKNSIALERFTRKLVTEVMITLGEKIIDLQTESAQSRYDKLLKTYPDIFKRAQLGQIASYLGIRQQTLSKIRALKLSD